MTQMVSRAVGMVNLQTLWYRRVYERQAVSVRLLRRISRLANITLGAQ